MNRIVVMGPPGVGKGTQSERLAVRLGIPTISTGNLFREHVREETLLGRDIKVLLDSGSYVPDSITNSMVAERLGQADVRDGFILDGYPRTVSQAEELDRMMLGIESKIDVVLLLEAGTDEIVSRLMRRAEQEGRTDDTPEAVAHRLDLYAAETSPLVDEYESRDLLVRVDSRGDVNTVESRVLAAVALARSVPARR